jgi:hypothetical protein
VILCELYETIDDFVTSWQGGSGKGCAH